MDVYDGPELYLPQKYALLLWYIYMAFTYGAVIPIMFPLATIGMINLYVADWLLIVYFAQKPPNYD